MNTFEDIRKIKWILNLMMKGFHQTETVKEMRFASCLMQEDEDQKLHEQLVKYFERDYLSNLTLLIVTFESERFSIQIFVNETNFSGNLKHKSRSETSNFETKDLSMLRRSLYQIYRTFLDPTTPKDEPYSYSLYEELSSFLAHA